MFSVKDARLYCKSAFLSSPFLKTDNYNETSALLDADLLIGNILKKNRAWILSHQDFSFSEYQDELFSIAEKRKNGLPIAYITSSKEFYGNNFFVNPSVLIPKPDTELLVEEAAKELRKKTQKAIISKIKISVLDACTGSGCVGISIFNDVYKKFKDEFDFVNKFQLVCSDISSDALHVCKKNINKILPKSILKTIILKKTDIKIDSFFINEPKEKYDVITANPPYVPTNITDELLKDGRFEPRLAIDGGDDGLDFMEPLAKKFFKTLKNDGAGFVEIGEYHSEKAFKIFKNAGFADVKLLKDLSGKYRLLKIFK